MGTNPDNPSPDFLLACIVIGPVMDAAQRGVGLSVAECRRLNEAILARLRAVTPEATLPGDAP